VEVDLNRAIKPADITSIDLQTTFTGGIGGDNWNMQSISVRATGNGVDEVISETRTHTRLVRSDFVLFRVISWIVFVARR